MPKANSGRIAEAQRQRENITKKSEKYGSSTVYLQVLGSGARGAPNTLYLFTDQKRYLFNCGECTQRLAHEHKVKLSKLNHIFITTKTWRNIGGLPGLSLTLQDVGVPNITLHGPEGLDELYNATKRFVIMRDMNVTMAKCSPSNDFEDNVMTVKYVLLGLHDSLLVSKDLKPPAKKPKIEEKLDKEFEEFIHDDTDYYRHESRAGNDKHSKTKDKAKLKTNAEKESMTKSEKVLHDLQKKSQCSVAYICTLKKRLGTLDLAKCVEMGVPPGPLLGQLKAGHDVVLPDGKLVLSKDVKTPDDPGPVFIVLEVPELLYLKETEFSEHFDNGQNPPQNIPTLIVHYTPPHVFHHPKYRAFMALFGPTTRHLVLNAQNSCLGSEAVHRTQHKLHLLDPDIFPLLKDASVAAEWNAPAPLVKTNSPIKLKGLEDLKNKIALAQFQNIINMEESCKGDGGPAPADEPDKADVISARTLTAFHLRPRKELDRSAEPKLHIQDYIQETMDMDGFVGSLEHFRQLVEGMRYASGGAKEFPKVVFLGTGSCIPSKTRNTSAIVIHVDENRSMLLDCGEGTFGQLVRFYGPKRVDAFLRTLKAVYISHLHADHHIGLIGVIQARCQAFEQLETGMPPEPLYLLAPGQIVSWLSVYDQQFERIRPDFTLIPNQNLLAESPHHSTDMTSAVLASIGVARVTTCFVSHCPNAFGVAVDLDGTHKVTYSGDTIPCEELVKIGQDSTLLIHEATMEDELAEEARVKMHSTTTQAIDIGRQMNAKYTVLTHFSQRYARLPRLNANILNDNKSVGIAFDNMQITMSDLELLPHMYAPLQLMFAEHCVEMEMKAAHRARHKERRSSSPGKSGGVSGPRWMSPGCRTDHSSPQRAHSRYRESNASRLRQELKGMTVTGRVQSPRPRSTLSPPSKIPQPIAPRSPCSVPCTPSRSRHDRLGSPREPTAAKSLEPIELCMRKPTLSCKECDKSPNKISTPSSSLLYQNQDQSPNKLQAKSDTVATRRTTSNSSNLSKGLERVKVIAQHSTSRVVVDSHSKTLSSVSRPATGEEVMNIMANNGKSSANTHYETGGSGYGKPLVTPFNKRLTIMRNNKILSNKQNVEAKQVSPVRSPIRSFRAENIRDSSSPAAYKMVDGTQKIPNNAPATGNKLRGSITTRNVKPDTKSAMEKPSPPCRPVRPTSLTRYDKSPTRQTRSMDYREDTRIAPVRTPGRVQSPIRNKTTEDPLTMDRYPLRDKKPMRKPFAPLPDIVIDRLKQPLCKKNPITTCAIGRPCSGIYSNKSYKPQLEDIKSSYLLLHKQSQEKLKDEVKRKSAHSPPPKRPNPLDDEQRQHKLKETRQKYQSKGFFNDSKYDKIEGLNWISWK